MNFSAYIWLLRKKDYLDERIRRLESNLYYIHPSTLSHMPRGSLNGTDGLTDNFYKLFELCEEREKLIKEIKDIELKHGVNNIEHEIVFQRNILDKPWKDIAQKLNYTMRHVQRIYNNLIKKFF